ncbi:MAG: cation:proton antiporter [Candidatus Obscuribacter sp.]|jgi:CPA2 family monovalent cation:H+ antiporter-2|nr:cation:proton antiporter [Candidatus Obscuribacter sp.]MBK7840086.1 cation:proton antiporter [Candidatus Obscuribacter sp.]MBK9204056.1 cation:proton antiporter [Candidatus Obscuribacter sp.]MBK9770839.1 cation:proton antiporter [Candidatus Obscuribacter sp.]MBL0186388.1 cation:proton antiporter [Candidatus Obscuribacter sp.]
MAALLQDLLVVFGMGVALVMLLHRFNLPSVLGFLLTGVIAGPFGLKLVEDVHAIEVLAEIGLVLLLFEAGIEFSVKTFIKLKRFLLIAGTLQLLLTIGAATLVAQYGGLALKQSIFMGMLASLSSTALVIRLLDYRGDIDAIHGRAAMAILIFQDLCIVPLVLITPYLAGTGGSIVDVLLLTGKALLFVAVAGTLARFAIPWLLGQVARLKKREAFVLSIMLLCLGTAVATSHFGLSMALGAFIAGLVISDSKYSHQALSEVLPIREVLNCLVFVSIGMLFDIRILLQNPGLILCLVAVVMLIKVATGFAATMASGHTWRVALLTSVAIAQASEFSFVISKLGLSTGLIDHRLNQLFLATAILTMFLTPALISGGSMLEQLLAKLLPESWSRGKLEHDQSDKLTDHTVVIGYSGPGKSITSALKEHGLPFVIIDYDPATVKEEIKKGTPILFGDASRPEVLQHAGIARARVIVITASDPEVSVATTELARRLNPSVTVLTRARRAAMGQDLKVRGANVVVADDFAAGLALTEQTLTACAVSDEQLNHSLDLLKQRAP